MHSNITHAHKIMITNCVHDMIFQIVLAAVVCIYNAVDV